MAGKTKSEIIGASHFLRAAATDEAFGATGRPAFDPQSKLRLSSDLWNLEQETQNPPQAQIRLSAWEGVVLWVPDAKKTVLPWTPEFA